MENAFRVISGDFVTTEDGTELYMPTLSYCARRKNHTSSAMLVLDENGTPVPLVDLQGKFTSHVGEYAGKYVKNDITTKVKHERSVDVEIIID
jgi:isoleucyl-tRNA synthetase